jgi:hypothetical protein
MSKYILQVLFNRPDRTYRFNEEITGKVVLETQSELKCKQIWIDYGWRTHGQGNRDKGDQKKLTLLSEMTQFHSGGHREFPFTIKAPNGPVTYHGHAINVDWYITGHTDIPFAKDVKKEQDFLLLACESPSEIILGNISLSKAELPAPPKTIPQFPLFQPNIESGILTHRVKDKMHRIIAFTLYIIIGLIAILFIHSLPWYVIALLSIAYLLMFFGFPRILTAIASTKFDIHDLRVEPSVLYVGSLVTCHLAFQPKSSLYLDNIDVKLRADETAISNAGTQTVRNTYRAYEKTYTKSFHEKLLAGRYINLDCALPILLGAPATFESTNNSVKWFVGVKLKIGRWLSWEKTFPITVLPC